MTFNVGIARLREHSIPKIECATQTMSSREIAALCEKRHDHVIRDIEKVLSDLGEVSPQVWGELPDSYGRSQRVAFLSKSLTLTLISGYSTVVRKRIIDRWLDLEAAAASKIPQNYPEALRLAAMQAEENLRLQKTIEQQRSAVEFVGRFVDAESTHSLREVAKILDAKEREFIDWLRAQGIIFKQGKYWLPFAKYQHAGYFTIKVGELNGRTFEQMKFTPKGLEWIAARWLRKGNSEAANNFLANSDGRDQTLSVNVHGCSSVAFIVQDPRSQQ